MNVMQLPPKTAQEWADKAKAGQAHEVLGSIYVFYVARQEICLVSLDPPQGHVKRLNQREWVEKCLKHGLK